MIITNSWPPEASLRDAGVRGVSSPASGTVLLVLLTQLLLTSGTCVAKGLGSAIELHVSFHPPLSGGLWGSRAEILEAQKSKLLPSSDNYGQW